MSPDGLPDADPIGAFLAWRPNGGGVGGGGGGGRAPGTAPSLRAGAASVALTLVLCVVLLAALALPALAGVGPHGWSLGRLVLFCHLG